MIVSQLSTQGPSPIFNKTQKTGNRSRMKVIQHMRDEAHRFGITHHRKRRTKGTIKSSLSEIEGVGPKTIQLLLNKFRSVEKIKNASLDEIVAVAGKSKGTIVYNFFHKKDSF